MLKNFDNLNDGNKEDNNNLYIRDNNNDYKVGKIIINQMIRFKILLESFQKNGELLSFI